ncbi:putative membrane protein [Parvibaculum indicum]|uniref:TadG family pilus assembly protein n=1 Tax=Parvibaculum indicum TaxID=562969 RepID=UPI00141E016A|nr:TadG family pilus assembly protein [Parvibaculum indicum]NIJ43214.1 putative membrane protein [Parvibaculum indicum]
MKRSLISLWHRFADDDSGAISILAVGAIVAAIGVSVIVVDAGSLLYAKRQLQAAADAAAMSAVRDIGKAGGDPTARAEEALAANGFDDPQSLQVLSGGYDADESIAPASRFDTAAGTSNAVKVMTSINSPTYFAQFFGVPGTSEVYAESTAAMVDQASISAGTGLASLNDGIANNLLTALLGTAVNLSAANYQGLVDTKIDALAFLDALATRVGVSGTYGDLLSANASVGDIVNAALDVLASGDTSHSSGDPVAAQQALNALPESALNALDLSVNAVIDASELQDRQIGNIVRTGTNDLKVNAYDLLIAAVMGQANGETIDLGTTLSLPVTGTSISTRIAIGQPEAQSKIGPVGTQVKTAQIILALEITAVDTQPTGLGTRAVSS